MGANSQWIPAQLGDLGKSGGTFAQKVNWKHFFFFLFKRLGGGPQLSGLRCLADLRHISTSCVTTGRWYRWFITASCVGEWSFDALCGGIGRPFISSHWCLTRQWALVWKQEYRWYCLSNAAMQTEDMCPVYCSDFCLDDSCFPIRASTVS